LEQAQNTLDYPNFAGVCIHLSWMEDVVSSTSGATGRTNELHRTIDLDAKAKGLNV
jgi:hypothetical protein